MLSLEKSRIEGSFATIDDYGQYVQDKRWGVCLGKFCICKEAQHFRIQFWTLQVDCGTHNRTSYQGAKLTINLLYNICPFRRSPNKDIGGATSPAEITSVLCLRSRGPLTSTSIVSKAIGDCLYRALF